MNNTTTKAAELPEALDYERAHAIRQGNEIAASDGYFGARPQIDTNDRRKVFQAGFERGWDGHADQVEALSAAQAGVPEASVRSADYEAGWKAGYKQGAWSAAPQPVVREPLPKFSALKFHARRDQKATVTLLFQDSDTANAWVECITQKGGS